MIGCWSEGLRLACIALALAGLSGSMAPGWSRADATPVAEAGDGDALRLSLGATLFRRVWVSAPASTASADGLGPLFNARSCAACHPQGGGGRVAMAVGDVPAALVMRLSSRGVPEPTYGVQLQPFAVQGQRSEGRVVVIYEEQPVTLHDGTVVSLRRPSYRIDGLGYGPLASDVILSPRLAPSLVGLGPLARISDDDILARIDAGASGIASRVWSDEAKRMAVGRFGWKAGAATLRQQVAQAFARDLGLSNTLLASAAGDCTARQPDCLAGPHGGDRHRGGLELDDRLLDLVTFFAETAVAPRPPAPASEITARGERAFASAGCAACHRPSFLLPATAREPAVAIHPYSDLLLHDMGDGLADEASAREGMHRLWRTAPLWRGAASGEPRSFLHDGRARSVEEAVLWHGGEARASRDAFVAMARAEREALVAFVQSR